LIEIVKEYFNVESVEKEEKKEDLSKNVKNIAMTPVASKIPIKDDMKSTTRSKRTKKLIEEEKTPKNVEIKQDLIKSASKRGRPKKIISSLSSLEKEEENVSPPAPPQIEEESPPLNKQNEIKKEKSKKSKKKVKKESILTNDEEEEEEESSSLLTNDKSSSINVELNKTYEKDDLIINGGGRARIIKPIINGVVISESLNPFSL